METKIFYYPIPFQTNVGHGAELEEIIARFSLYWGFYSPLQVASSTQGRSFLLFWKKVSAVFMHGNKVHYKE